MRRCVQLQVLLFVSAFLMPHTDALAQRREPVSVQTFVYESDPFGVFKMPPRGGRYERVLMRYTVRCPYNSPCGEKADMHHIVLIDPLAHVDTVAERAYRYTVNGRPIDSLAFVRHQSWQLVGRMEITAHREELAPVRTALIGTGITLSSAPFLGSASAARSEFMWRSYELDTAGLKPGRITGLRYHVARLGTTLKDVSIALGTTKEDSLPLYLYQRNFVKAGVHDSAGNLFTVLPRATFSFPDTGWYVIPFLYDYEWKPGQNLIVDMAFRNGDTLGIDTRVDGTATDTTLGVYSTTPHMFFSAPGISGLEVPASAFPEIDSEMTIAFWTHGSLLPGDFHKVLLEGVDRFNRPIVRVYVDSTNNVLYWDAGRFCTGDYVWKDLNGYPNDGGYHYWTFTKNLRHSRIRIYMDGYMVKQVRLISRTLNGLARLRVGAPIVDRGASIADSITGVAIWKREIPSATIRGWMGIDPRIRHPALGIYHPFSDDLVAYYPLEQYSPLGTKDASGRGNDATFTGAMRFFPSDNATQFMNTARWNWRPNVIFEQGTYATRYDTTIVLDSIPLDPIPVVRYRQEGDSAMANDTMLVWPPDVRHYRFAKNGTPLDTMASQPDTVIHQESWTATWHRVRPERYELGRLTMPFGTGVNLGDGYTWTYDVTDYLPLLHDSVQLQLDAVSALVDVAFDFYPGIPARDPISVTNLWNGTFTYGAARSIEEDLKPLQLAIPQDAANVRLKVRSVGLGSDANNCASYCPKQHTILLDDEPVFSRLLWRDDCGLSPIFPQGGDWVRSRANFCPGTPVQTFDVELSEKVKPGGTYTLDYNVEPYTMGTPLDTPRVEVATQLITYGPPNFALDASIERIISPNDGPVYRRNNPSCGAPAITLRNNGTTPITTVDILYGGVGRAQSLYRWSGSLAFTESADISLASFAQDTGVAAPFRAVIASVNGVSDQYHLNDTAESVQAPVDGLHDRVIVEINTNNKGSETSYTVTDAVTGAVMLNRSSLANNTRYRDTLNLPDGCYQFTLKDSGNDGLYYYYHSGSGRGSGRLIYELTGEVVREFSAEFGSQLNYQFHVTDYVAAVPDAEPGVAAAPGHIDVYPNPASGEFMVQLHLPRPSDAELMVYDLLGRELYHVPLPAAYRGRYAVPADNLAAGVYLVVVRTDRDIISAKVTVR
ncbi:MAG: T9SS type A sorting domain-containing protein [Bacteroidetes bacterium]|nr:T9SS type A sorting domain-containing protein [Bacteroidota bacterium]